MKTFDLTHVIEEEDLVLKERRELKFGKAAAEKLEEEKFGIALSGGGIRSATINLGFLKTLNVFGILKKADYISTVSGGGYTGAYVQVTVQQEGYDQLFEPKKIKRLQKYGDYWIPGQGKLKKFWNTILLTFGYLVSWAMSLFSPLVTVLIGYLLYKSIASIFFFEKENAAFNWNDAMSYLSPALWALGGIVLAHMILNLAMNFSLGISKVFTKIESYLLLAILMFMAVAGIISLDIKGDWTKDQVIWAMLGVVGLILLGFVLNPNSLSFHRFYRKQLADAFLGQTGQFSNMLLKDVFTEKDHVKKMEAEKKGDFLAPYPLINTCLNLQNPGAEDKFKGAKASDYFLLSPKFCGSNLSKYVETAEFPGFKHLTLPAALTISAAAVNPGMGIYSNKLLSITMTLLNARLGFWVNNPDSKKTKTLPEWTSYVVWWPSYFFKELFSKIGTTNRKLNVSDGGHIENLAVYELLRRKCRLILAFDAGADPSSSFADLANLSLRARNELGIDIAFKDGHDPVDIIRPRATSGYAQKRFAVAELITIWEEFEYQDENGNPFKFTRKYRKKNEDELREIDGEKENLEYLVNYYYSKENENILKFLVELKAVRGLDIPDNVFDDLKEEIEKKEQKKLLEKKGTGKNKIKFGTLVYIKSSVTPSRKMFVPKSSSEGEKNFQYDSFKYKIYHPDFPHESTADQFFDPVQWESYFQLGQSIGSEVLGVPLNYHKYKQEKTVVGENLNYQNGENKNDDITIEELVDLFEFGKKPISDDYSSFNPIDVSHKPVIESAELEGKKMAPSEIRGCDPELEAVEKEIIEKISEECHFKI